MMVGAKVHDKASEIDNAAGEVMISGRDGVAVSMTPQAARKTGARLIRNAAEAQSKASPEASLANEQEI